jgi:hypothetical protein
MDELRQKIAERFTKGIRKSFSPCPLIGPKWVQAHPKGKPADFRFLGVRKLAKAMGFPPAKILNTLMAAVKLDDLDLDVDITNDFIIHMNRSNGHGQGGPAKSKAPKAGKPKAGNKPRPKGAKGPNRNKKKNPKPRE